MADLSREQLVERTEEFIADVQTNAMELEELLHLEVETDIDITQAFEKVRLMRYTINMLTDNLAAIRRVQLNTDLEIQKRQILYAKEQEAAAVAEAAPGRFSFGGDDEPE